MDTKLDKIAEDIQDIKVDIAEMRVDVNYHIKRTDLLEAQIAPLKKAHIEVAGAIKFVKILGILAGVAEAIRFFTK